ncbi:MAG: 2-C-methyl-D-erythritol 4-phosphate cytidylyltransferase [Gemmatimonadales bacterium]|jgi:2-C-methyl-D-erythritol 4-phosphate cytidylyltransferase
MRSSVNAWAVIVAGGQGRRFGGERPKQFIPVRGKPLAAWALEPFQRHPAIRGITLVVPAEAAAMPPLWLERLAQEGLVVAAGGAERTDSVRLGLETVPADVSFVAVHDAARPLITEEAIGRVLEAAGPRRGAVAGRRVTDSLKEVDAEGRVLRAVNRERLWRAETPQAFPRELIVAVHRDAAAEGVTESDCAALCERYGVEVVVVEIATPNPKVTRAEDLALVDSLLQRREMGSRLGL